jgi:hypothetical protein
MLSSTPFQSSSGECRLISFKAREGHCNVPVNFVEGEFKLGQWVTNHRNHRDTMPTERQRRLGEIGFVWSRNALKWERAISALKSFKEREGHCRVPKGRVEGGFKLGVWLNHQREHEADLALNRREQLNALGFIWDTHIDNFDEGIVVLEKFKARENHCLVPAAHFENKFRLGKWVQIQRNSRDIMPAERMHLLSAIGFVWDGSNAFWQEGLEALKAFKEREGHCRVPRFVFEKGFRLGQWVKEQRKSGRAVPANRWQLLDDIGFVWHPQESEWEDAFLALSKYRAREGHCRVPSNHIEGTIKLGAWVRGQRGRKSKNTERNKRLEEIGFDWDGK